MREKLITFAGRWRQALAACLICLPTAGCLRTAAPTAGDDVPGASDSESDSESTSADSSALEYDEPNASENDSDADPTSTESAASPPDETADSAANAGEADSDSTATSADGEAAGDDGDPTDSDGEAGADNQGSDQPTADDETVDARLQGKLFSGGRPNDVIDITFDDVILGMQPDVVFRPFMLTERAKELDGKRVRIKGFIMASDRTKGIEEFVLLRNTECKFGPGGKADHLLRVFMKDGQTAEYTTKPISIEGVIKINPFPDPRQTWSVFDLQDAGEIQTLAR